MITIVLEEYDKILPEVERLVETFNSNNIEWAYIKHPSKYCYRDLEKQLELSKLAIIMIAGGVSDTAWVNICIQYSWALKKYRQSKSFDYIGVQTDAYINKSNPSKSNFTDNSKILSVKETLSYVGIKNNF